VGVAVNVVDGVAALQTVPDADAAAPGVGLAEGGATTQLWSVTYPGVPLAPSPVARPVALPVVDESTTLGLTYDEPPPPLA
jgi:hypothetical protein